MAALNTVRAVAGVGIAPTATQWNALNASVDGRLHKGSPLALPCFSRYSDVLVQPDAQLCAVVEANYTSPSFLAPIYSGYTQVRSR